MYVHNGFTIDGFMHSNPGTAGVTLTFLATLVQGGSQDNTGT